MRPNHRSLPSHLALATFLCVCPAALFAGAAFDQAHSRLDRVLQTRVNDAGLVDYAGLAADRAEFDAYLAEISSVASVEFQRWGRDDQLAFLINSYNALTIQVVLAYWPVDSIKDTEAGGNPWAEYQFSLLGRDVTLDEIENVLIRPVYREPLVHFGLVCAARSCPPLRRRAYTGATLRESLEANARAFLADPAQNDLSDPAHLRLSAIFDWYGEDFVESAGSVARFVQNLTGDALDPNAAIDFRPYDWDINSQ